MDSRQFVVFKRPAQHRVQPEARWQRQGFVQPFRQTAGRGMLVPVLQLAVERSRLRTQRLGSYVGRL